MDPQQNIPAGKIAKSKTLREYLQDTKESIDIFKWLFSEVTNAESRRGMESLFMCLIVMTILLSLQPGLISYVFDGLRMHESTSVKWGLAGFIISLTLHKLVKRSYDRSRELIIGIHMGLLDNLLAHKFFGKSLGQHAHLSHILSPTTIDKGKWKALDMQRILLFDGVNTALQLSLSIICLLFLNWISGLIMLAVFVCYITISLYLNSVISNICTPLDSRFRALSRRRAERLDCVERVVVNAKGEHEVESMTRIFEPIIQEDRHFWFWFIDVALLRSGVNVLGLSTVLSFGAWMVWKGEMSLGMLYPLYAWSMRVSDNVWQLAEVEHQINWIMPQVKSMIEAINITPDIVEDSGAVTIDPCKTHRIEFCGVSHSYPPEKGDAAETTPAAVKRVSFTIEPGQKVSLLGPSGSGKSTMMKKLLRFSDPTEGVILVDGIPLTKISLTNWRKGIGYISQQAQVLDGTIRYNLTYGLDEEDASKITDDELWSIMRLLKIDFGERLTQGLNTVVGKNGIKLSGGQAQRLMIGAAVIKKPWLLVVDEATASLDSTTEREVQDGLNAVLSGLDVSALVVAHRLSTVRSMCDKHVVLRPVNEVGEGETQVDAEAETFEALADKSAVFRRIAEDQGIEIGLSGWKLLLIHLFLGKK